MIRHARLVMCFCICTHLMLAGPVPKAVRKYTIGQFMKTIRFGGSDISPDEQNVLFSSNQDGVFNLYEIPFDGSGQPKQLTSSHFESLAMQGIL